MLQRLIMHACMRCAGTSRPLQELQRARDTPLGPRLNFECATNSDPGTAFAWLSQTGPMQPNDGSSAQQHPLMLSPRRDVQ